MSKQPNVSILKMEKIMKQYKSLNLMLIALATIVLVSIVACAQPPEEEMAAARQAVGRAADNADVRQYAPQLLGEAQRTLSDMESASERKEYDSARSLAGQARNTAERAVQDAANAKGSARNRAETAVAAATAALEEARDALNVAQAVPGIRLDFQAVRSDLATQTEAVAAAETEIRNEQFSDAGTRAENARSSISDIVRRISNAVRAASGK